ncbi:MAG: enoyl-CoA hydratase/isomerase family protein, partial [Gemmatimonadales bacterium]
MIELSSEFDGSIHRLILNRPARRNALTPDLARALAQEIEQIEESGGARVILLSGAGGHFCAGLDLRWLDSLGSTPSIADLQRGLSDFQSAIIAVVRSPIPVLAVVQGTVAGFGFDLALACDMRLAGSSATFTSAFARMGLVPDGGSTFTLPRLVGVGRALRVLMTDQSIDAQAALSIG